jgi:S-adenosylmethionine synthetase
MPYPISIAHKLTKHLTKVRKDGILNYLRPALIIKMLDLRKPIDKTVISVARKSY